MVGKKTHERQLRTFERKPGAADPVRDDGGHVSKKQARESEFPVSRGGLNKESDHHKHNREGQSGNKPQSHGTAE